MTMAEDLTQAGVGGPGIWDPMPVPPPVKPEPATTPIWSQAPAPVGRSAPAKRAARKRTTSKTAGRKTSKKKAAKKKTAKKKAIKRTKGAKKKTTARKSAKRATKSSGRRVKKR